jgi:pSer/pThr/pTyr-binding forkhead associated (FHA) protein
MKENTKKSKTESIKDYRVDISDELSEKIVSVLKRIPPDRRGLIVIKGPNIGDKFFIDKSESFIGRSPESDVLLDDITVSRKHVIIKKEKDGCRLIDAGSLNGSYINGNIVEEAILQDGDRLQIGKYIFLYFSK